MRSRVEPVCEQLSDDELARQFVQTHDGCYFEALFQRHGRAVFLACLNFHRNPDAAEDAVQETFLRAFRNINSYDGGDLLAWLLRIARNCCIDRWRRKRPEISYDDSPADISTRGSQKVGTAVHLALLQLEREMATLPPQQQNCLALKAEGFSYEETAARIGGSTDDVRSHIQNGRRTLRLRMADALSDIL